MNTNQRIDRMVNCFPQPVPAFVVVLCLGCVANALSGIAFAGDRTRPNGICVVLDDPRLDVALPIARESDCIVYVQILDASDMEAARRKASAAGLYGKRLFIDQGDPRHIHLADNIADRVMASDPEWDTSSVSKKEVLRVLRPMGKAITGGHEVIKPLPEGVDDWSHPYHGPDNNPQSRDRVAVAPYLTQFLAEPYYAPLPQVATSSAGRLFKAYGHIAFKPREEALLNTLVAYNGYNGGMLWKRPLTPGLMIHRNTMIATPGTLYLGDDTSCKCLNAETGELQDEIIPPKEIAGGTFWKWMALEDGVLYALLGADEQRDPKTIRMKREAHGWPWDPLSPGFNQPINPWGFGRHLLAIDVTTKQVLWHHHEETPIDGRSLCMKNGRIFFMRFGAYLGCLDAKMGTSLWYKTPKNDAALFETIGQDLNRQDWRTNWRTTTYLKCSDKALYLAGPMFEKLLALSAENGSILWRNAYNNFQLVLREEALYAISGQIDAHPSKKFDPLSGEELGDLAIFRRACARPSGSADALFFRANGGSVRLDVPTGRPQWISPMRAQCHDGVMIANGLLYWWPSVCDCQLTLYGMTSLGPAGDFDFSTRATEALRLEQGEGGDGPLDATPTEEADWPTYRSNNTRQATSSATVPKEAKVLWQWTPPAPSMPTPPVAAGELVYFAGFDGIVHALNANTGREEWTAFTGGPIRIAPTVWNGRVFVGSGDGWAYAFEARGGKQLWRFRAAPVERKIPVYGSLVSTWPVNSGILVEEGVAYFAAGIVNYDGTYVYALDAKTGEIRWQNTTSGHLDPVARTGVSVQGHLLLHDGKLYMAGGTSVSPAIYDIRDGKCLNNPEQLKACVSIVPRGWELSLFGNRVFTCGQPMYRDPDHRVHDPSAIETIFLASTGNHDLFWTNHSRLTCCRPIDKTKLGESLSRYGKDYMIPTWGEFKFREEPLWRFDCPNSRATALCHNGVVVANDQAVTAIDLENGQILWEQPLPARPVEWGMAVDRAGRAIVTLGNGQVVCVGK